MGPMHILKVDVRDSFYGIVLCPINAPNLGLVSPSKVEEEESVAILLTLNMGWKNSTPIFCMATDTVVNIANSDLC